MNDGPLVQIYRSARPRSSTGLNVCQFFETHPDQWFTHAEIKSALGCGDRVIREYVPEVLNRLLREGMRVNGRRGCEKGSIWELETRGRDITAARYHGAP